MVDTAQRREWPRAAQLSVIAIAAISAVAFVTGFFFTLPVSVGVLVVGLLAKRELGRLRGAVIVIAALGVLLAIAWMLLSLDIAGSNGQSGPYQGIVVE